MGAPIFVAGLVIGLLGQLASANVVARVDDDAIPLAVLQERIEQTRAAGGAPRADLITEDLINEALMAREARRRGLAKEPGVVAAIDAERRRLAAKALEQEIVGTVKVDEKQLTEAFHNASDVVNLEGVVLATEADAKAALERLQKGAKLADESQHSFDTASVKNKGNMGSRNRGRMDAAFAQAAFSAPLNTFIGPIKLDLGWGVVRVTARQLGDEKEFAARREGLLKFAEAQTRAQYKTHYVMQLRKQASATVDETFLRSTGTKLDPSPADAAHVISTVGSRRVLYSEVVAEVKRLFGGVQGGHASGPGVKIEMSWSLVDRALMENAAIARGLGESPDVRAKLPAAERDAFVRRLSSDLRAGANQSDEPVRKMIADLRSHARIEVNRDVLARAGGVQK